ncbi:MAG TPA: hypothetical protein VG186_18370 [Solirubrobacteraceae bacterium]|nr:hypothetical protein [Solirubrobacteraceae bacterium]
MTLNNQTPWWELEAKVASLRAPVDIERERLRSELARAWRSYLSERETHPPGVPYPRAS